MQIFKICDYHAMNLNFEQAIMITELLSKYLFSCPRKYHHLHDYKKTIISLKLTREPDIIKGHCDKGPPHV